MKIDNVHAETSLLASVLCATSEEKCKGMFAHIRSEVDEDFFYSVKNKMLFKAMTRVYISGVSPDYSNVYQITSKDWKDSEIHTYCNELLTYSTSPNIDNLLDVSRRLYTARNLQKVCRDTSSMLESSKSVLEEVGSAERKITDAMLSGVVRHKDEGFASDYMVDWFGTIEKQMSGKVPTGIPTGLKSLDNITGGLKRGDLITVAGRTGMGKSSLVATWIAHQLIAGYKPALFTFELQRKEVIDKTISILSELDGGKPVQFSMLNNPAGHFGGARLTQDDLLRVSEITQKYIKDSVFFIRGKSKMKVEEGMTICRKLKSEGKIDVAYFDHIGLMVQNKSEAVSELSNITGSLLLFAGEMEIPVVIVAQLNRGADSAIEKPKLSHLKGSGSIEEDSNVVIMPWRPYAINREGDASEAEIILAKSRNTGTGELPASFSTVSTMFSCFSSNESRYGEPEGVDRF